MIHHCSPRQLAYAKFDNTVSPYGINRALEHHQGWCQQSRQGTFHPRSSLLLGSTWTQIFPLFVSKKLETPYTVHQECRELS